MRVGAQLCSKLNTLIGKVVDSRLPFKFLLEAIVKQYWTANSMIVITNQEGMRFNYKS